jgi:PPK2 family polyphosphate:nucleotide phosphotransferase
MNIHSDDFKVLEGSNVVLDQWATEIDPFYGSKDKYHSSLKKQIETLSDNQQLLYASNKNALLIIFQAMDAAGKDGALRHVLSGINPQGCQVHSFKHPSATELDHDFLWRTTRVLPERGKIGVFNRSYYEEVLIVRVHPEILKAQRLPVGTEDTDSLWASRFASINDLERHLHQNGTRIIKFFLHLSQEEQSKRFLKRIDKAEKNWKFSEADIAEREFWPEYMQAYETCLSATSTEIAPWYVVPADDKRNARLIIAKTIADTFTSMDMHYPQLDDKRLADLQKYRKLLVK